MPRHHRQSENHRVDRAGWLRAAVLGANDGVLSTASLIAGVAASSAGKPQVLIAGAAAMVAGALSMAAGEYVSVSSQADSERADLAMEAQELKDDPHGEEQELAGIYHARGLSLELSRRVAQELMAHDALGAHARDELGMSEITAAQPVTAALSSAASFAAGAIVPLVVAGLAPKAVTAPAVIGASLLGLVALGAVGAKAGGAPMGKAVVRVVFWGALAMAVTTGLGRLLGAAI